MGQHGAGRAYRRGITRAGSGPRSQGLWARCPTVPVDDGAPHPVPGGDRGDDPAE